MIVWRCSSQLGWCFSQTGHRMMIRHVTHVLSVWFVIKDNFNLNFEESLSKYCIINIKRWEKVIISHTFFDFWLFGGSSSCALILNAVKHPLHVTYRMMIIGTSLINEASVFSISCCNYTKLVEFSKLILKLLKILTWWFSTFIKFLMIVIKPSTWLLTRAGAVFRLVPQID